MGELWYAVLLPLALVVLACFFVTFPVIFREIYWSFRAKSARAWWRLRRWRWHTFG